ncbi:MAG: MFS transporter [Acidimicrobiaceae bacterium]|nr:MFS transporter [Acidimicrobiaceae bacterium]
MWSSSQFAPIFTTGPMSLGAGATASRPRVILIGLSIGATMSSESEKSSLRGLWMRVYVPNLLIATGQGAMIPVLVFAADRVHASPAAAGLVVALNGFGTMIFDLPAGRIIARLGEANAARISAALLGVGLLGCLFARSFPLFVCSLLVQAAGWGLWSLVRLTHLSRVAPALVRGRALSLFGGVIRAGNVIGPFLYVAIVGRSNVDGAFLIYLVCVAIGFTWQVLARDRTDIEASLTKTVQVQTFRILSDNRRVFATAGVGVLGISLLRGSRNAIIPLWAAHLGLSAAQASTIFAFSSLIDLAFFYPAGVVSDRWGRKAVAIPCMVVLSIGHILVPFSHAFSTLFLAALVLGFGNGMGSGIVMTLGADFTPAVGRSSFLAVWRLVSDGGTAVGPLIDSGIVAVGAIALAGPVLGLLGLALAVVVTLRLDESAPNRQQQSIGD